MRLRVWALVPGRPHRVGLGRWAAYLGLALALLAPALQGQGPSEGRWKVAELEAADLGVAAEALSGGLTSGGSWRPGPGKRSSLYLWLDLDPGVMSPSWRHHSFVV